MSANARIAERLNLRAENGHAKKARSRRLFMGLGTFNLDHDRFDRVVAEVFRRMAVGIGPESLSRAAGPFVDLSFRRGSSRPLDVQWYDDAIRVRVHRRLCVGRDSNAYNPHIIILEYDCLVLGIGRDAVRLRLRTADRKQQHGCT
jgi:hypothetical protein